MSQSEQFEATRNESFVSTYVNHVRIQMSKWDIGITVGHLEDSGDGETTPVEAAFLQMSPAFARALGEDLLVAVGQYESVFGEVTRPQNDVNIPPADQ